MIAWSAGGFCLLLALSVLLFLAFSPILSPPMCTGPAVERCDYIAVAKAEADAQGRLGFDPAYGIDVFDIGSSVWVQQHHPHEGLIETTAVVIDKRSCRPCSVETYREHGDPGRGRLLLRSPPADPTAAAALARDRQAADIRRWPNT